MKKSIISLLAIFGLLVFTSCEDSMGPVMDGAPEAPEIMEPANGASFVLNEEDKEEELEMMEWSPAEYGYDAAVEYTIEMDAEGDSFEDPVELASVRGSHNFSPVIEDLNASLLGADLPFDVESVINIRVRADVNDNIQTLHSRPVEIGVTPYEDESLAPSYPEELYMIGASVGSWDWAAVDLPMIPVFDKPYLFWKIVWIESGVNDAGYKFAPEQGWGEDFGWDGNDPVEGVHGIGTNNMPDPGESGYYMVVVNLETDEVAVVEPQVYLIGDTVDSWDSNVPENLFTVDNANEVLTITKDFLAGDLRMYAWYDGGWFTDWWQSEFIFFDGNIEFRGTGGDQDRVAIPAGEATIELNFRDGTAAIN
ncbi:SusF/SusE family outer membrane protein [Rhodohalobacter barkolensis]|uniref:Uncharacterized protein n=1 Tax=Rhodohalobacter barkolensis TaxID=2053187 RepID=A0A2N0VJM5_9BACT|nr:SusE domain-containing protein [Rhodohalobacter barkolensis]PKD44354.1 hypothetical protein CWD77_02480 [Rhodohalobacter barkolensis]